MNADLNKVRSLYEKTVQVGGRGSIADFPDVGRCSELIPQSTGLRIPAQYCLNVTVD